MIVGRGLSARTETEEECVSGGTKMKTIIKHAAVRRGLYSAAEQTVAVAVAAAALAASASGGSGGGGSEIGRASCRERV